jgi:hypothetical protein
LGLIAIHTLLTALCTPLHTWTIQWIHCTKFISAFSVPRLYATKGYLIGIPQAVLLVVNTAKVNVNSNLSCDADASQMNRRRCRNIAYYTVSQNNIITNNSNANDFKLFYNTSSHTLHVWNCLKPHSPQHPVIWDKKVAHVQPNTNMLTEHNLKPLNKPMIWFWK